MDAAERPALTAFERIELLKKQLTAAVALANPATALRSPTMLSEAQHSASSPSSRKAGQDSQRSAQRCNISQHKKRQSPTSDDELDPPNVDDDQAVVLAAIADHPPRKRPRVALYSDATEPHDDDAEAHARTPAVGRDRFDPALVRPRLPDEAWTQNLASDDDNDDGGERSAEAYARSLRPLVLLWPPPAQERAMLGPAVGGSGGGSSSPASSSSASSAAAVIPGVSALIPIAASSSSSASSALTPASGRAEGADGGGRAVVRHVVNPFLAARLKPHQVEGVRWLHTRMMEDGGCILADDMGMGKTAQACALIAALLGKTGYRRRDVRVGVDRVVYAAPPPAQAGARAETSAAASSSSSSPRPSSSAAAAASSAEPPPITDCAPSFPRPLARGVPGAPVLILAPPSVLTHWRGELDTWGWFASREVSATAIKDLPHAQRRDMQAAREAAVADVAEGRADILLVGHELGLTIDGVAELVRGVTWGLVICDECHSYKNPDTQRFKAFSRLRARGRLGLTGTPVQNNLGELWALLDLFVRPRLTVEMGVRGLAVEERLVDGRTPAYDPVGDEDTWRVSVRVPIELSQLQMASPTQVVAGAQAQAELKRRVLDRFLLHRLKVDTDVGTRLPDKRELVVYCELGRVQRRMYAAAQDAQDMAAFRASHELRQQEPQLNSDEFREVLDAEVEHIGRGPLWRAMSCHAAGPCGACRRGMTCLAMALLHKLQKLCAHTELIKENPYKPEQERLRDRAWADQVLPIGPLRDAAGGLLPNASLVNVSNPALSGKVHVLLRILRLHRDADPSCRVLVFSRSVRMLRLLEDIMRAQLITFRSFDGSMSSKERDAAVKDFNAPNSQARVFLISVKAGGVGLNLTSANVVVLFDPDWNPSTDAQAQDRAYRIGQTRDVTVYRLVTLGTLEEAVYLRQVQKTQVNRLAMQGKVAPRLFDDDFKGWYNLLRYRPEGHAAGVFARYRAATGAGRLLIEPDALAEAAARDDDDDSNDDDDDDGDDDGGGAASASGRQGAQAWPEDSDAFPYRAAHPPRTLGQDTLPAASAAAASSSSSAGAAHAVASAATLGALTHFEHGRFLAESALERRRGEFAQQFVQLIEANAQAEAQNYGAGLIARQARRVRRGWGGNDGDGDARGQAARGGRAAASSESSAAAPRPRDRTTIATDRKFSLANNDDGHKDADDGSGNAMRLGLDEDADDGSDSAIEIDDDKEGEGRRAGDSGGDRLCDNDDGAQDEDPGVEERAGSLRGDDEAVAAPDGLAREERTQDVMAPPEASVAAAAASDKSQGAAARVWLDGDSEDEDDGGLHSGLRSDEDLDTTFDGDGAAAGACAGAGAPVAGGGSVEEPAGQGAATASASCGRRASSGTVVIDDDNDEEKEEDELQDVAPAAAPPAPGPSLGHGDQAHAGDSLESGTGTFVLEEEEGGEGDDDGPGGDGQSKPLPAFGGILAQMPDSDPLAGLTDSQRAFAEL